MKKICALIAVLLSITSYSQDFSNKGTDFWVGYGSHISMYNSNGTAITTGGSQDMVLYFATDVATNVTVNIPSVNYTATYAIPANSIYTSSPLPKTGLQDLRLTSEGITTKGIHIIADHPVVAYAHIYASSISGATLLFPTKTLGKQYYSINYDQKSNGANSYCFFYAIATDTGTTTIEVTPSANTQNMLAGTTYTYYLQQGQVFNALGSITGNSGVDLTGSKINSISTGNAGCKRIAVFSGSGKIYINCASNQASSADNYMVQSFPSSAWGKHFLTAPTATLPYNFFRICVSDASAVVKVDGIVQSTLVNNFYYSISQSNLPHYIEADKPITIAQYISTQGACGNGSPGDPEVIYLSPIEQNINKVILNSTPNYLITEHHINAILPTTGVSSFKLDGLSVSSSFKAHPQLTGYSYCQLTVAVGAHTISSDSGFNAIAYGYGSAESYGYNAGANVVDLTQGLVIQNQYATSANTSQSTCVGTPFVFKVKFPYQPLSITWDFGDNPNLSPNAIVGPILNPVADSTYTDNNSGKTIYIYKLPGAYTFSSSGIDTINVTSNNPTSDGCSGEQKQSFTVSVYAAPIANFGISTTGCLSDSVHFTDSSSANIRPITQWRWNFDDISTDSVQNPVKKYSVAKNYNPSLIIVNDIGCYATVSKPLALSKLVSNFGTTDTTCINGSIIFSDSSTIVSGTILNWFWDYGDGLKDTLTTNALRTHNYSKAGVDSAILTVVSSSGCQVAALKKIIIHPRPKVGFVLPEVCLQDKFVTFTDTSYISDGSQAAFKYNWKFSTVNAATPNPTPKSSTLKMPVVQFFSSGNYNVIDTVTSNFGCKAILSQPYTINGSLPKSIFTVKYKHAALCSNDSVFVVNASSVDFGAITKIELYWDLLKNPTQKFTDDSPYISKVYAHLYPNFQQPLTKKLTVRLVAYSGFSCVDIKDTVITLNASPSIVFAVMPGICLSASPVQITQAKEQGGEPGKFSYKGIGVSNLGLFSPAIPGVGIDTVYALYTSTVGCVDSANQTKTIWPIPTAAFNISTPTCVTQSVNFIDSSIANYSNIKQWLWSFGDGQSQTNTSNATFTHNYLMVAVDTVKLHVFTDSGCVSSTVQQTISIHPLPQPNFSLPIVCLPVGKAQFFDSSLISDSSQALFSYLWNFGESVSSANTATVMNGLHYYATTGPFDVTLTVTSKDGCVANKIKQLATIYPQPMADFTAQPTYVCLGDAISFIDKSNAINQTITNWYWNFGNNTTATSQNSTRTYTNTGTFATSLYVLSNQGCYSDTSIQSVTVYPYPIISAGPDLVLLQGGQIQIQATATGSSNYQYTWTPNTWLSSDTVLQPIVINPLSDITYTIKVIGAGGCVAPTDDVFVKVLMTPIIPNAFSPNGDGINDLWTIKYLNTYLGVTVQIFDRYGKLVNDMVGYDKPWDGKLNGVDLPIGTYYYIVDPKNGRQVITGSVTILR